LLFLFNCPNTSKRISEENLKKKYDLLHCNINNEEENIRARKLRI